VDPFWEVVCSDILPSAFKLTPTGKSVYVSV